MISIALAFIVSSIYFFVQAAKQGMGKKRWALGGLLMGPMLIPMFTISKRVFIKKTSGKDSMFYLA